jgi:hypothetical protein
MVLFKGRSVPGIKLCPASAAPLAAPSRMPPPPRPPEGGGGGPHWAGNGSDLDDEIPF